MCGQRQRGEGLVYKLRNSKDCWEEGLEQIFPRFQKVPTLPTPSFQTSCLQN